MKWTVCSLKLIQNLLSLFSGRPRFTASMVALRSGGSTISNHNGRTDGLWQSDQLWHTKNIPKHDNNRLHGFSCACFVYVDILYFFLLTCWICTSPFHRFTVPRSSHGQCFSAEQHLILLQFSLLMSTMPCGAKSPQMTGTTPKLHWKLTKHWCTTTKT